MPSGLSATMPALTRKAAPAAESALSKQAYWSLLVFVFFATSRLLDFTLAGLHLPLIVSVYAASCAFISAGPFSAFATNVGKFMGLYTIWFVVSIPFSQWRGGSFQVLTSDLLKSFLLFVTVICTINSARRVRGIMLVFSLGTIVAMALALYFNDRHTGGRLALPSGQLGNPNDLAQAMMLGMFFLPVWAFGRERPNKLVLGLSYLVMLLFAYVIFATASRGVLLSVMMVAGIIFWRAGFVRKILLGSLFLSLIVGLLSISDTARKRLTTLYSEDESTQVTNTLEERAESSTEARVLTLKQSIVLTLQNPLFGVGPGNFESAAAAQRDAEGQRALWVETHNSYTQISSEIGIPGLLFFCCAIGFSLTGLFRIHRYGSEPLLIAVSRLLLVAFLGFLLTAMFSSTAYHFMFWFLIALCASCIAIRPEKLVFSPAAPAAAPVPFPPLPSAPSPPAFIKAPAQATRVTLSGRIRPVRDRSVAPHKRPRG